jgi:hypothetical protein
LALVLNAAFGVCPAVSKEYEPGAQDEGRGRGCASWAACLEGYMSPDNRIRVVIGSHRPYPEVQHFSLDDRNGTEITHIATGD